MPRIRLARRFTFEGAHYLPGYDGLCANIHGHSYQLTVTIIGEPNPDPQSPKVGMALDFSLLKAIVNQRIIERLDHTLVVREDQAEPLRAFNAWGMRILPVPFQPTCENLLLWIAEEIKRDLPNGVELHHVRLHETENSYAEWYATDM